MAGSNQPFSSRRARASIVVAVCLLLGSALAAIGSLSAGTPRVSAAVSRQPGDAPSRIGMATSTPTPTPIPTATPTPIPSSTPTATPTAVPTPTATRTPTGTPAPTATPTPGGVGLATPTKTATATGTAGSVTPTPSNTATPTAAVSGTPTPTATPLPVVTISAAQQSQINVQLAAEAQWLAQHPYALDSSQPVPKDAPIKPNKNGYYLTSYIAHPEPQYTSTTSVSHTVPYPYTGTVLAPTAVISTDPMDFYHFLCGPGSITTITSSWNQKAVVKYKTSKPPKGWYGFMYAAANNVMRIYQDPRYAYKDYWGTLWQDEENYLNRWIHKKGHTFKTAPCETGGKCTSATGDSSGASPMSEGEFLHHVAYDILALHGPLMAGVTTLWLNNWVGRVPSASGDQLNDDVDHFISIVAFRPSGKGGKAMIAYADTASQPALQGTPVPGSTNLPSVFRAYMTRDLHSFFVNAIEEAHSKTLLASERLIIF
jgi:hypothetical protein